MKKILIFLSLSLALQQNTYTQETSFVKTVAGLLFGGLCIGSGYIAYTAASNTHDSFVGLNIVVAPVAGAVALGSGIIAYQFFK